MNMNGLNRQEASIPKKGERATVLDLGFHTGQIVKLKDPSSQKLIEGKIVTVGFDSDGSPEVAIEVANYGLMTVPQEEFFKLNPTQQEVADMADAFNDILKSDKNKSGDFN